MKTKKNNKNPIEKAKKPSTAPDKAVLSELESVLEELDIPKEKSEKILEAFISVEYYYKAPFPPPSMLKAYGNVVTNGAERIMEWVEQQSKHRMELEKDILPRQANESSRGQIFGFIITLICLGITTLLAMTGHDAVASIVGGTTVIGLVTVFVSGKAKQEKNLSKKQS